MALVVHNAPLPAEGADQFVAAPLPHKVEGVLAVMWIPPPKISAQVRAEVAQQRAGQQLLLRGTHWEPWGEKWMSVGR